jgi:hypothetical protein
VTTSFGRETSERIIGLPQCFGPRFGSDIPPLFHKSFQNGDSEAEARFRLRNSYQSTKYLRTGLLSLDGLAKDGRRNWNLDLVELSVPGFLKRQHQSTNRLRPMLWTMGRVIGWAAIATPGRCQFTTLKDESDELSRITNLSPERHYY